MMADDKTVDLTDAELNMVTGGNGPIGIAGGPTSAGPADDSAMQTMLDMIKRMQGSDTARVPASKSDTVSAADMLRMNADMERMSAMQTSMSKAVQTSVDRMTAAMRNLGGKG